MTTTLAEDRLLTILDSGVRQLLAPSGGLGSLEGLPRGPYPDSVQSSLLRSPSGRPLALLQVSGEVGDLVAAELERGDAARGQLGDSGGVVLRPLVFGFLDDGRTWALWPYARPLAGWQRPLWRRLLRTQLLEWFHAAAAESARALPLEPVRETLAQVASDPLFSTAIRAAASAGLSRLRERSELRRSLVHRDLWLGNVLLLEPGSLGGPTLQPHRSRFAVVDWKGSVPEGHAILDLIDLARSLGLSRRALAREARRHARFLGCSPAELRGLLVAELGNLRTELGFFPASELRRRANAALTTFDQALRTQTRGLRERPA